MTHFDSSRRRAFTIVEMLAVVMLIGVMVGLLLPAVQAAREAARRTKCSHSLMQLGLAVAAYHSSFDQLPTQLSGTGGNAAEGMDNDRRLSFLVPLLPFINNRPLWEKINSPLDRFAGDEMVGSVDADTFGMGAMSAMDDDPQRKLLTPWVTGGPEPFQTHYGPWQVNVAEFRCSSDPGIGLPSMGRTNYAACLADGIVGENTGAYLDVNGRFVWDEELAAEVEASMRGMFVPRRITRFSDTKDGLSNTIMLGEIATDLGDHDTRTISLVGPGEEALRDRPDWAYQGDRIDTERPMFWGIRQKSMSRIEGRGYRWADGMPLYTAFNTIFSPNSAIALAGADDTSSGVLSASSRHQGGANVCFGDGAVRFVTESIDAGARSQPTAYLGSENQADSRKSRFGLWGALGTRSGTELVFVDDPL